MGSQRLLNFLDEILTDAIAYKELYGGLDKKELKRFHEVVKENSEEAYQVSRANHGGASPYPYTYKL